MPYPDNANVVSAVTSGSARILSQSKPGWFGSTVAVAGRVLSSSRPIAVSPRRAAAIAPSTVPADSAISSPSTVSDRHRRRVSSRSQASVTRMGSSPSPPAAGPSWRARCGLAPI